MRRFKSGQALVVVLLVLGMAVTVGLSIVSRSVTEVAVSTAEDESVKALEAAEAGVERALGGLIAASGVGTLPATEASYSVQTSGVGGAGFYEVPYFLEAGEVATIDLGGYGGDSIGLCWGRGTGAAPAIEMMLYYRSNGVPRRYFVGRAGFDPDSTRAGANNFRADGVASGCAGGPPGFANANSVQVGFAGDLGMPASGHTPLFLRVRTLYNESPWQVAVTAVGATSNIPTQGTEIISTGQAGDSTQRLRVIQSNPDLPAMFDAALFSGGSGGLVK